MCVYADPLSEYPSIKQLSEIVVDKWHELCGYFHLTEDEMECIRNSRFPSTETFLAAKVKNMDLKWKDILKALLSIDEHELAHCVFNKQGWLIQLHTDTRNSTFCSLSSPISMTHFFCSATRGFWCMHSQSGLHPWTCWKSQAYCHCKDDAWC